MMGLTTDQVSSFDQHGYLILPGALSPDQVEELLVEANRLLNEFSLDEHPLTKFSAGEKSDHVGDEYFLTSGDKVRFFFEEGRLVKPKARAINKIGHYLHELNAVYRKVSVSAENSSITRDLGFRDPRLLQSMIICKQPEIGGRVPPHQDSTFLYTNPPSAIGFWYALQDCTVSNGCLSFAPGSHKRAPILKRFARHEAGTAFIENEGSKWPAGLDGRAAEVGEDEYELAQVKAGTLVLIHGNIMHKSERNTSAKGRMIYTFHVIEGKHEFDERNWLQPPGAGFTRL